MQIETQAANGALTILKNASIALMRAEADYETASNEIILTDEEYRDLKNAEMRKAYVTKKLGALGAIVLQLAIAKKEAEFESLIADNNKSCAKYLIIKDVKTLVA